MRTFFCVSACLRGFIAICILVMCFAPIRAEDAQQPRALRVLFIGNSYTAYNGGIYKLLPEMAAQRGHRLECVPSVSGGKSLEWHYTQGKALERIREGRWDFVVLQDYSLQALNKRELMREYIRKFDEEIDKIGGKTVLYMTWARQHQPENQKIITNAYESDAAEVGGIVAPVGRAWQESLGQKPDEVLHRADKSHPNACGTYLAACVFYATLLNESPVGLAPPTIKEEGMEARTLQADESAWLQNIAWKTCGNPATQPAAR